MENQMVPRQNLEQEDEETDEETTDLETEEETSECSTETSDLEMEDQAKAPTINWNNRDEEIRLAYITRVENSQKPSMWEYNPKGGVPTELANLDSSTFLTSRKGEILCFLPRDVLIRICSMLPVCYFVHLSLTCRFLHWRMFTFCTCYAPLTVGMIVRDDHLSVDREEQPFDILPDILPKVIYILTKDILKEEKEDDDNDELQSLRREYVSEKKGQRGLYVYQPFCLRKPFIFETLVVKLYFPFYYKKYYDRCLPYIMAVRGLAHNLDVIFSTDCYIPRKPYINFSDTNDFLATTKASYYESIFSISEDGMNGIKCNRDIYLNCPYARQMNRVSILEHFSTYNVSVFENSIGVYRNPLDSTIIATLKNFRAGSTNLVFHQYVDIEENNGRFPLIEYLFEEHGEFEEFFYARVRRKSHGSYHIWNKAVETENGGQLRIVIRKKDEYDASVMIGKEEMFEEMDTKYAKWPLYHEGSIWWKMETAVEPDELEDPDEPEKLDEAEESVEAGESGEDEELGASTVCRFCTIL